MKKVNKIIKSKELESISNLSTGDSITKLIELTEKRKIKWMEQKNQSNTIFYCYSNKGDPLKVRLYCSNRDTNDKYKLTREYTEEVMYTAGERLKNAISFSHPQKKEGNYEKGIRREKEDLQLILRENPGAKMIGAKDFVVRKNVFKCACRSHKIKNITAILKVFRSSGDKYIPVNAGYCTCCNEYYLMSSTVDKIKKMGITSCRIFDENKHRNNFVSGDMILKEQSILMDFGYNVSKEYDLSETVRHKILANIVDNGILSTIEVISYLDFFISQHNDDKFQEAIGKWENDRDFIENYKVRYYMQYGVAGLRA